MLHFILVALSMALAGCDGSTIGSSTGPGATVHTRFAFAANDDGTVSIFGTDGGTLRYAGYTIAGTAPVQDLAVAPDNRHLYVLGADGTLGAYAIDATTGALTAVNSVNVGSAGSDILLSEDGRFLYAVAGTAADAVAVYAVSAATGGLRAAGSAPTGSEPVRIALSPAGTFAYVLNGSGQSVSVYTRDTATGTLTKSTSTALPAAPTAMSLNKTGAVAYITFAAAAANVGVYSVDAATGDLSPVQTISACDTPVDIVLDADNRYAYAACSKGDHIDMFSIGPSTGRLTAVQSIATPRGPGALALTADGHHLYAATQTGEDITAYAVDAATGKLTLIRSTRSRGGLHALALSEGGGPYTEGAAALFVPDSNVHIFPVSGPDGALRTPVSKAAGTGPVQITLSPGNRYAYVVNRTSNTVSVFQFDAARDTLGPLVETDPAPSAWQQSVELTRAVIEPSGRFLYLLDHRSGNTPQPGRVAVYGIDKASGALTYQNQVSSSGVNPLNLVIHPAGGYLYVLSSGGNSIDAFAIDAATGALSSAGSFPAGQAGAGRPVALAFSPDGRHAYVSLESDQQLLGYDIDPNGGLTNAAVVDVTPAEVPTDPRPRYIAVDPAGRYAYVTHWSGDVSTWAIDPDTYALTFEGRAAVGSLPAWISLDPNGRFAYAVVTGGIARLTVGQGGAMSLQEITSTGTGDSQFRAATVASVVK